MAVTDCTNEYKAINREIILWRKHFLNTLFDSEFKNISDSSKDKIRSYFLSIPSESFTTPLHQFHNCICAVINHIEDKK